MKPLTPADLFALTSTLVGPLWLLLAGWVHYLVFDFFVGAWIARDRVRVPRPLVVTCLIACFLAGPLGLLMYLLLRGTLLALERARAT